MLQKKEMDAQFASDWQNKFMEFIYSLGSANARILLNGKRNFPSIKPQLNASSSVDPHHKITFHAVFSG